MDARACHQSSAISPPMDQPLQLGERVPEPLQDTPEPELLPLLEDPVIAMDVGSTNDGESFPANPIKQCLVY